MNNLVIRRQEKNLYWRGGGYVWGKILGDPENISEYLGR